MTLKESRASVYSADNRAETPVYPHDVFTPTDKGLAQFQGGDATALPREALAVLVLLDGKEDVGHIEQRLPGEPALNVRNTLRSLIAAGLVREVTLAESGELEIDFAAFFGAMEGASPPSAGTEASARREAEEAHPELERHGYYVSIARQALKPRAPEAGPLKALLVEDDPMVSMLVSKLLAGVGFSIAVAENRGGVVAQFKAPPLPDIILLDVYLPDVNGFDILQRLKTHPVLKAIPVLMLTSESGRESIARGLTLGADGYVTKPFDPRQLVAGVKSMLGMALG